jgi:hypothetical protein
MVVAHETRTSGDLVEALSHAIGISYAVVAAAIVALPVILISVGTPVLQLLAIRSILARAIALPTRVGLWERFLATPESLARSNSYLGLTFILLTCVVYGLWELLVLLRSPEADWSILLPLTIGSGFILLAIAFMAAFLSRAHFGAEQRSAAAQRGAPSHPPAYLARARHAETAQSRCGCLVLVRAPWVMPKSCRVLPPSDGVTDITP